MSTPVRTRFAPSPTGYMHLGNLRTALYTYLMARKHQGTFILRIEDTDQEREVPGGIEMIYKSLRQAGLTYDEGPDVGGPVGPYVQSARKDMYLPYALDLVEKGGAYPCFCTKEQLDAARAAAEARGETYKYEKTCLHLPPDEARARMAAGESCVIRQNVPTTGKAAFDDLLYGHVEVDCDTLDDNVLIKADGLPTYNFANVVDDHLMGISHVMRGNEYLSSAPKYSLLYQAFGWEQPLYMHLTPVMKDASRKLSKRKGDPSFEDLLDAGYLCEAIINFMALLGWSPGTEQEFFTLAELEQAFDPKGLSRAPAIFDMVKLTWFNTEYIRKMPFEAYCEKAMPYLREALDTERVDMRRLAELMHSRTEVFSHLPEQVRFLGEMPDYDLALYTHKKMKTDPTVAGQAIAFALPVLEGIADWTEQALHDALMPAIAESGMKNGQVLWPVRIAITGKESTPGGAIEMAYLLGREETLARLRAAQARLAQEA